jgi:hypothetical protein
MYSWWILHAATLFRRSCDIVLRSQVFRRSTLLKDLGGRPGREWDWEGQGLEGRRPGRVGGH